MALMDFLSGGMFGGAGAYGDLLSDEQKKRMQQQGMMAMAAQLLQAGAPSRTPSNLGSALGQAYLTGQQAYGQAGQNALTQMLTQQKIDEYQRQRGVQDRIQQFLMGGSQPSVGTAAPSGAMAAPGTAKPSAQGGPQNKAAMADRYRQLAAAIAPVDPTKANTYMTIADKMSPVVKPTGQPIEVRDPSDPTKNILMQQYSDGSFKPAGLQPAGMSDYQRAQLGISQANLGIARANLGISQEQLRRGEYTLQQTADGFAYVPKVPNMPVVPVMANGPAASLPVADQAQVQPKQLKPAGAKPTADQSNAVGFAKRMERSSAILEAIPDQYPGTGTAIAESIPLIGEYVGRQAMSPQQQQYRQAANDWIRAKLRKESGAAIGENEMAQEYATYFPMPGDSPEVVRQKAQARRVATEAMKTTAGDFYRPWNPSQDELNMLQNMRGVTGGAVQQNGFASGAAEELRRRRAGGN